MMNALVLEAASSHLKLDVAELGEVTTAGKEGIKVGDKGRHGDSPRTGTDFPSLG